MTGAWIDDAAYGMCRAGTSVAYAGRTTLRDLGKTDRLFAYPVKNHGRFDAATHRVFCLTALALRDAGIAYGQDLRLDIGLLATDRHGCAEANLAYFKDYVEGGRTLARANLFLYTLPSSPAAEAAVHFGLQGPLLYLCAPGAGAAALEAAARRMLADRQAGRFLLYDLSAGTARCWLADRGGGGLQEPAEGTVNGKGLER